MSVSKAISIFLFLFMLVLNVRAQNINVKSFHSIPDDTTARITAPVSDQNGDICALIKIRTSEKGFVFDGDMLGITKTSYVSGEYWVYVPPKARKITLKHPKLGILDNYIYPEAIREASVYVMELTTGRVTTTVEAIEIITQYVEISSTPSEADVYINKKYVGQTPLVKLMPVGKYNYRIEKSKYNSGFGFFTLEKSGRQFVKEELLVNPKNESREKLDASVNFGSLNVNSNPIGADVILDGKLLQQKTPCVLQKITNGIHHIKLKKKWYEPQMIQVNVMSNREAKLTKELIPVYADFKIKTNPQSDIFINGKKVGYGSHEGREIEGYYIFEARKDKYDTHRLQLNIVAGKSKEIQLNPRPKCGSLNVITKPFNAIVKVDGIEKGTSPIVIRNLQIGDYQLELSKEGFGTIEKQITIQENKTTKINEELSEARLVMINSYPQNIELMVDGVSVGKTPYSSALTLGSHTITLINEKRKVDEQILITQLGENSFEFEAYDYLYKTKQKDDAIITMELRKEPQVYGEIIYTIPDTASIYVLEKSNTTYTYVAVNGYKGYVSSKLLADKGTFIDSRDGNSYKYVTIGEQVWMGENLRYKSGKYIANGQIWCENANKEPAYCWLHDNADNKYKYGAYYNYAAAENACPSGWHLPSAEEFFVLLKHFDGNRFGNLIEGGSCGFDALPGGLRKNRSGGTFERSNLAIHYWSSTSHHAHKSQKRIPMFSRSENNLYRFANDSDGLPVRCIED